MCLDRILPGVLPELNALGALLEANPQWLRDAAGVRARMLAILGEVAERYVSTGAQGPSLTAKTPALGSASVCRHHWPSQPGLPMQRASSSVMRMPLPGCCGHALHVMPSTGRLMAQGEPRGALALAA